MAPNKRCAVAVCPSPADVSYHRFPKDPKLRKVWTQCCKRDDPFNEDKSFICGNHFLLEDFERDLKHELLNQPLRKVLKSGSIPSINLKPEKRERSASSDRAQRTAKKVQKEIIGQLTKPGM
jgi:hypothetical protein